MRISFVEIQNFRKLKSIRVDFSKETTVFVGSNNSGKTSAMMALNYFLIDQRFVINDFTLSNLPQIDEIGTKWEKLEAQPNSESPSLSEWSDVLPSLDTWMHVEKNEIHHVSHILPTLDWAGGLLGIRLRFEPENIKEFHKEYIAARKHAKTIIEEAKKIKDYSISLWPANMTEFLEKKLHSFFTVHPYILDPSKISQPKNGIAHPQPLSIEADPIEGNPFKGLIRIDKIDAHRGFSNLSKSTIQEDGNELPSGDRGRLSDQLRSYYKKHIDPSNMPDLSDIDALQAIYHAQKQFDEKLKTGFQSKFEELGDLGYPGVTDPKLDISTKIKPIDGLNHSSALKYKVAHHDESTDYCHSLPEQSNGLGYQNLISMVFRLMSFRDDWMQVGKMGKKAAIKSDDDLVIPPLHLVLVEEPEAHLHAQVQQVFIREAYKILRKHPNLGNNNSHTTQLTISTHSSHIAHECEFSYLRYFRRKPAECEGEVPISTVINLSEVFGKDEETERFVTRYIKTTHCDLFFADAAILIEGSAERILVPYLIREHFPELSRSYITLLEINGSHAHRLRPLIERLGLTTLIVADLDSVDPANNSSIKPARKQNLTTRNETLKTWLPKKLLIDELLDLNDDAKVKEYDPLFCIRVAYQCPIMAKLHIIKDPEEFLSRTFEDALVFENIDIFKNFGESGLAKKFKTAISQSSTIEELSQKIFEALQGNSDKAGFALDILCMKDLKNLKVPTYLNDGLAWLQKKMSNKNKDKITISTPQTDHVGEIL